MAINKKDILNGKKNQEEKKDGLSDYRPEANPPPPTPPLSSTPRPLTSNNCATSHKLVPSQ